MKTKPFSLIKRAIIKNMFPSEIHRLKHLVAMVKKFNRMKFDHSIPPEYSDAAVKIESLIPQECREVSYVRFEMREATCEFIAETLTAILEKAVQRTTSRNVKEELTKLIELNLYEGSGLSEVSSETSESTAQEVSDLDEPHAKRVKN